MTDTVDTLLIDVRASTQGFAQDIATMRSSVDSTLTDGFSRAGDVLERGLVSAVRRGSLGFDDLRRTALGVIDSIAAQAVKGALGDSSGGGLLSLGTGLLGAVLGLPGRATGGPVSPGRGYVVGERGPELFVPTSAGRVEAPSPSGGGRDVRVAITVNGHGNAGGAQALQRSSRQVASAVRRALREY
jgi:hypothetical protein